MLKAVVPAAPSASLLFYFSFIHLLCILTQ
jgi:hypothetical protein